MNLFSWLTTPRTTTKRRTLLSVDQLEARDVPAAGILSHFNAHGHHGHHAHHAHNAQATQSSISGIVQIDTGAGAGAPWFATTVSLSLNGTVVQTVTANPDGSFKFTVSLDQSATFKLEATMADGSSLYLAAPVSGTLAPGGQLTGQNLLLTANG